MKKMAQIATFAALVLVLSVSGPIWAQECTTIQSGTLLNSAGEVIETGFGFWGYNYQARMFNGGYCDSYRDAAWCQPYKDVELIMKWNDAWLSNEDCDADGLLDRHPGDVSYLGSGAWLTNHQSGTYPLTEVIPSANPNKTCRWTYFVKIVAAPSDATLNAEGHWEDGSGTDLGEAIWGSFAIVQQVENDPCAGQTGLLYKASRPGLGNWEDPNAVQ